ncbi:glycosyltransferase family 2 protein [Lutibacter flavus]|uniref:Glycosyltransferase, GT2 family n=1 Tax=Lutibacter flavus TaxID=691689 RepID=A0A238VQE4_9FLAO|nr:glycosyltransferase [Lutibacter flavus]SNR36590.1 Glycosyltransferase, GT2 family [Lutibacter flavus]
MIKLSAIFLSNTVTDLIYETTINSITTLKNSEKFGEEFGLEIILVESNKEYYKNYEFSIDIKVIIPDEEFGFHKFLNIGIETASGDYIALCNNDLIFYENWFAEIIKVKKKHPEILSFSPYDETSNKINKEKIELNNFVLGYEIQKEMTGWCFIVDTTIFNKIKKFDERFKFYYADNDYAMCLIKYNIKHALVCKSKVRHLDGVVTKEMKNNDEFIINKINLNNKELPEYVRKNKGYWELKDDKMSEGVIKFHKKWGSLNMIKYKFKIIKILERYNLSFLNKYILTTSNIFSLKIKK